MLPSPPVPAPPQAWSFWAAQLIQVLQPIITRLDATSFRQGQVLQVGSFAVADLPSATTPGRVIYVSDEAGGAVLAFSDGTNWLRVTDRMVVS